MDRNDWSDYDLLQELLEICNPCPDLLAELGRLIPTNNFPTPESKRNRKLEGMLPLKDFRNLNNGNIPKKETVRILMIGRTND